ncbi:protein kinase domain-containing protein [Lujinxingia litoralis]|nr:protein kinase [Lujinxingia litoralis]
MVVQPRVKIGDLIDDRYRLEARVHDGRWGPVFRASDLHLGDRPVAIRIFACRDQGPADSNAFAHLAAELRALNTDTIATPYAHGSVGGCPYIITQWARGWSLNDYLQHVGRLSLEATLGLLQQLCEALDNAHQMNLTHGLLRPSKIRITPGHNGPPTLHVVDFQIWRLYELASGEEPFEESKLSRRVVRYMAPEILSERRVTPAADLYAAGLLAMEMLTGTPAYPEESRIALIARQLSTEAAALPYTVEAGASFRQFLDMLVAKEQPRRLPNAAIASDILDQQTSHFLQEPPALPPEPEPEPSQAYDAGESEGEPDAPSDPFIVGPEPSTAEEAADVALASPPEALDAEDASVLSSPVGAFSLDADLQSPLDFLSEDADVDSLFGDELNFGDVDPQTLPSSEPRRPTPLPRDAPAEPEPSEPGLDELPPEAFSDIPDAVEVAPTPAVTASATRTSSPTPAAPSPRAHPTPPRPAASRPPLLGLGLIATALVGAAAFLLLAPGEHPSPAEAAPLEPAASQASTHLIRVTTSPPALRVLVEGRSVGFSPVELRLPEDEFPVRVGARLNANIEQTQTLKAPTPTLHFEFEAP